MTFRDIEPQPNFPKLEEAVLAFWKDKDIFQKSLKKNAGKPAFVFFEGPPTANGLPGLHHIEARAFKDVILRFATMRGHYVLRKAGWDTHGLPVEIEVEKSLQISGKRDIESLVPGDVRKSIEKFNRLCRANVWKYKDEWERFTARLGFWLDMSNPYITYENNYIESVWWILRQLWDKKVGSEPIVYQGHKVLPYCPRCGTALSSHEVAQGYKAVEDNSVYVKFRLRENIVKGRDEKKRAVAVQLDKPTFVLSWTTTPWTLPGNVALAVGADIDYSIVTTGRENYIVATALAESVLKEPFTLLEKLKGKYLIGLTYEPLFAVSELQTKTSYQIYPADFVTVQDGTGVVHTAVMYGEDDYNLGTALGLPKFHTITEEGRFIPELRELAGRYVKDPETEKRLIHFLEKQGQLYSEKPYRHDYPFCWRCQTPLLYYARDSWFIRMSAYRLALQKNNQQITWIPGHIKDGRFGEWLAEVKDWAISRDRYWGTPLPFWQCQECKEYMCIGSIEELKTKAVKFEAQSPKSDLSAEASAKEETNLKSPPDFTTTKSLRAGKILNLKSDPDLHRPYVDDIIIKCDKCGGQAKRVPQVLDAWFDSGAMPYAQWHYPFEGQKRFAQQYPADFITEAIDQTRGWFYTLLALSTALGGTVPAYKNVICLGHILDAFGQKMSKSKGNVVAPKDLMDKYGIDIVRWYMYSVNQPGEAKLFAEAELTRMQRRVQIIFWNVYNYFVTYANANDWSFDPKISPGQTKGSANILDQWINARLQQVINEATDNMTNYDVFRASRNLEKFIDDLSTWYLRRCRGRADNAFFATLYRCLIYSTKLFAPFMPFFADSIYRNLHHPDFPQSVHLDDWPQTRELTDVEKEVFEKMKTIRSITESVLAFRKEKQLKVRQPLASLIVAGAKWDLAPYAYLLTEELNFLDIALSPTAPTDPTFVAVPCLISGLSLYVNLKLSDELKARGLARELERVVQAFRRESGLRVGQPVELFYDTASQAVYDAFEFFDTNKTFISRVVGGRQKTEFEKRVTINTDQVWLGLNRDERVNR